MRSVKPAILQTNRVVLGLECSVRESLFVESGELVAVLTQIWVDSCRERQFDVELANQRILMAVKAIKVDESVQ